jgi:tRNA G10  N-methylase Trm11
MQYIFILGRNPELSIQEIFSYLKKNSIKLLNNFRKENSFFVELNLPLPEKTIDKLGGTVAIGEVLCLGKEKEIIKFLEEKPLYFGIKNKFNYLIWEFCEDSNEILDYLKKRFKKEKLKATRKQLSGTMEMQGGEKTNFISSRLLDEQFIILEKENIKYFARVIGMSDYEEIEKRDIKKPIRRGKLSISPRLAKIMINLSEVKEGETLVDPFCGIGAILQEALLQNMKVIGIDIDREAVSGAKKNLEWKNFKEENYALFIGDSRKLNIHQSQGMATEPDLGEKLRVTQSKNEKIVVRRTYSVERAKQRTQIFEKLMINTLNNLKKKIYGKIVFTAPYIKTFDKKTGRIGCDIGNILNKTKLKLVRGFPIEDYRENQITGRQIFVLER